MSAVIHTMNDRALQCVYQLQEKMRELPQVKIKTTHHLHAGLYHRTIFVPAGTVVVGVMVKIPTTLIVSGHAMLYIGEEAREIVGYQIIEGAGGRKQAAYAIEDTTFTMSFATNAATVTEAENEFTDEAEQLLTRTEQLTYEEAPCLE